MDKTLQLQQALGRLSTKQAVALAHALELAQALGKETMPTGILLEGVRPLLREARAPRVPTLCRLVVAGFEDFLTDSVDEPRREGLVPRSAIEPWWTALRRVAGKEVVALEGRYRAALSADPATAADSVLQDAQRAAAGGAAAIVAKLIAPKPNPELRKLLRGEFGNDARVIAAVLPISGAVKASTRLLARLQPRSGAPIADLTPDCIALLKQHYVALSDSHGMNAPYLALAVLNRLARPCQILRLGRALSWKPNDAQDSGTEFDCVGRRIIDDLQRMNRAIVARLSRRGTLPAPAELAASLAHYLTESETLVAENEFRRGSPWGEAILKMRTDLADALDRNLLERFAQLVLDAVPLGRDGKKVDLAAQPSGEAAIQAGDAARLLKLIMQRGQRHGFGRAARDTVEPLGAEIATRVAALIGELRHPPANSTPITNRIEAAAEICDLLFDDDRGRLMLRQMGDAIRASA